MRTRAMIAAALPALVLVPGLGAPTTAGALAAAPAVAPSSAPAADPTAPSPGPTAGQTASARGFVAPVRGQVAREFDPPAHEWEAGHRGVDLRAPAGAVVVAPGAGVVTFAGKVAGKPVVVVTHSDGLRSSLEPVEATVAAGTAVREGDPVGTLTVAPDSGANSGHCAPDDCVHWGVRRGEAYLDPLVLLGAATPIVLLPPR
ncbi:peptidoglycan DD-metalloendopeptidase family protein [Xylanimonas sp. McL0601]|uniref:peptidoglycan DD-metalloendopeptidase family protein n=1 Tax=Xylanimonas sp. McL0601 TaxID=3414739 RepID=UPI003CE7D68B